MPVPGERRWLIPFLAIFFLSGAAALIYEVLWLRDLGRLFGTTAHAAAANLAVFFLGLSVGSWAWGRRCHRLSSPLRTYGLLEIGIAGSAVLYFALLHLYRHLFPPLFALLGDGPWVAQPARLLLVTVVLFPPAFLMGGTLPVMAQHLVRRADEFGRWTTFLYALNTAGAATGALAAGFLLPRYLGFRLSYLGAMALNLLIGAAALLLSRTGGAVREAHPAPEKKSVPSPESASTTLPAAPAALSPRLVGLAAAVSGFATLALEVLWTRMFAQVLQNSIYTFAAVLAVFLLVLAAGSGVAHLLCRLRTPPATILFALLVAAGAGVALSPFLFHWLTGGMQAVGQGLGWPSYVRRVFLVTGATLGPPGLLIGTIFPYLMKVSEAWPGMPGRKLGRLAALNTVAAIAGSLGAGFLLLEWLGLWTAIQVVAWLYFVLAALAVPAAAPHARMRRAIPLAVALVLTVPAGRADLARIALDPEHREELVEVREGVQGTVAVTRRDSGLGIKMNSSYVLGTSGSALNLRFQTWQPLALHAAPRRVFVLGMGTGISAGGALDFPIERLVVAELNPDVIALSRAHFTPWLNGLMEDPRARVVAEDGRHHLLMHRDLYDVVVGDIFLTYKSGVGSLYTREHFETIRSRLAAGGLFAQWLTLFDLSLEEFGIITRTMLEVFPRVTLWRRGFSSRFPVYALVGHMDESPPDAETFAARLAGLAAGGEVPAQTWFVGIPMAAYVADLTAARAAFDAYPVSDDDRTPLEFLTPVTERNTRGAGREGVLAGEVLAEWLADLHRRQPVDSDPYLAPLAEKWRRQVRAGLAFYRHEAARRAGDAAAAAGYLERYRSLVAGPAAD